MRELILQGGDVLKLQEENRCGKSDIEVSDVLQFFLCKEVNDFFLLSLTDHAPLLNSVLFCFNGLQIIPELYSLPASCLWRCTFALTFHCCKTVITVG